MGQTKLNLGIINCEEDRSGTNDVDCKMTKKKTNDAITCAAQ